MARWLSAATASWRIVADRPELWVSGGLAWSVTMGSIAILAAVTPVPTASRVTFDAARAFVSGAWPWNALSIGATAGVALVVALALVALADGTLLVSRVTRLALLRATAVTLVATLPAIAAAAVLIVAVATVGPIEFRLPDPPGGGGPMLRTLLGVGPLLVLLVASAIVGGAYGAAARVQVARSEAGVWQALVGAAEGILAAWPAAVTQLVVGLAARLLYLAFATLLLGVLWAPIAAELSRGGGFDAAHGALLVGFVAIWLCLVLGGGAVHAWGLVSWARILDTPASRAADRREMPSTS